MVKISLFRMLDENAMQSLFMVGTMLMMSYMVSMQRIKTLVGFRSMTLSPHMVKVYKKGSWQMISSYDLKPGDIIIV